MSSFGASRLHRDRTPWTTRQLVALAAVLATPIAYLFMHRGLQAFAYRVDISWRIFLLAGLAALVVTWLTVAYQSIKAALADPVKALRYE